MVRISMATSSWWGSTQPMTEARECMGGGPMDGERAAECPAGYTPCMVSHGENYMTQTEAWLWLPNRCACGRHIGKYATSCNQCSGRAHD